MKREHSIRTGMGTASALLLAAEGWIIFSASTHALHEYLAILFSIVIIQTLLYTFIRFCAPSSPQYGLTLPGMIFIGLSIPLLTGSFLLLSSMQARDYSRILLVLIPCIAALIPCYGCELLLRGVFRPHFIASAAAGFFGMLLAICLCEFAFDLNNPARHPIGLPAACIGMAISGILTLSAAGIILYYTINAPSGARVRTGFRSAVTMLICAGISIPLWGYICYWGGPELLHRIF